MSVSTFVKCANCGKPLKGGSNTCASCGATPNTPLQNKSKSEATIFGHSISVVKAALRPIVIDIVNELKHDLKVEPVPPPPPAPVATPVPAPVPVV
jgi:hypothetical protein